MIWKSASRYNAIHKDCSSGVNVTAASSKTTLLPDEIHK